MSTYYEHNDKGVTQTDVIEWDPPTVNFEFHSGMCVQVESVVDRFAARMDEHFRQESKNPWWLRDGRDP
jgi:hypothetical protein